MKKSLLILLVFCCQMITASPIKVACVGTSITFGAAMPNAKQNSYPAQLQSYLGNDYKVINFGVSGSTITQHSKSGYVFTPKYTASLAFEPNIVLLEFGTNDSKPYITNSGRDLKKDYLEVIHKYQQLATKPRIILVSPIKCFLPKETSIQDDVIQKKIVPTIKEIAYEENLPIIDLYRILGNEDTHSLYMDHLHPSPIGAGIMSQYIGNIILEKTITNKQWEISDAKKFNFYGFQGYDFKTKGIDSKLVMPKKTAQGRPWVLRARFWGHEPQTDIALLERGFAIAYCDVANLFGNSEAINRFDQLYHYMRHHGFAKKVVLEGMSRGGLPIYNWAAKNPKRVACIYADAPVLDTKSWPMGKYSKSNRSQATNDLLKAYNRSDDKEVEIVAINPIDNCALVAKSDIKILHVIGDADKVVPTAENTIPFSKKMDSLDHKIKVIHKPGIGHHPHSLFNPKPILHFILKSTEYEINACTHPICGNEFRSGAGWKKGSDWHTVSEEITQILRGKKLDYLLLGNSITQNFGGNRQLVVSKPGMKATNQILGIGNWESAGISGDRTQHLLWRLKYGKYNEATTKNILITIGINNLIAGDDSDDVADGVWAVAQEAKKQFPSSNILVLGPLPSSHTPLIAQECNEVQACLAQKEWHGMHYVNPTSWFMTEEGKLNTSIYGGARIHLNADGYYIWNKHIKECFTQF